MESNGHRLRQDQQQHSEESLSESGTTQFRVYNSVEELLREDANQNPPPESLSHRVAASTSQEAVQTPKSWWQKLMGE